MRKSVCRLEVKSVVEFPRCVSVRVLGLGLWLYRKIRVFSVWVSGSGPGTSSSMTAGSGSMPTPPLRGLGLLALGGTGLRSGLPLWASLGLDTVTGAGSGV
jgi:hypothetical protein